MLGGTAGEPRRGSGFLGIGASFSLKNRSKKLLKINIFFLSFLIAFGTHLGAIWEAKIDPRWAKLGSRRLLKRYFLKNVNFHETSAGVMSGAFPGPQDGTQNDPRSPQDGPKTVLFRFFFRFVFCIDFWSLFGAILVSFWGALGSPNRSFLASIFS